MSCCQISAILQNGSGRKTALKQRGRQKRRICVANMVRFWVKDNGPGLDLSAQNRLFQEFERLGQTRVQGHGLGLSVVRRIIERLNGQVGVESEVGMGSLFFFTLPAVQTDDQVNPVSSDTSPATF